MSGLVRRCGRPRRRDDAGMSLTELLVTMMIMSVVVIAATSLAIGFARTNAANVTRQDQIDTARMTSESMSKLIRAAVKPSQLTTSCAGCVADAFIKAEPFVVQFYANINNPGNSVGPSRVTYTVASTGPQAGELVENVQRPDSNIPTGSGYQYCDATAPGATADCKARLATRVVARDVVTAEGPLLKYYDEAGLLMTPPVGGSLSASELERVLSIELSVRIQADAAYQAGSTTYIQRIMLPNSQAVLQGKDTP